MKSNQLRIVWSPLIVAKKPTDVYKNIKSIVAARRIVGRRNKENIKQAIWINGFGQGIVIK